MAVFQLSRLTWIPLASFRVLEGIHREQAALLSSARSMDRLDPKRSQMNRIADTHSNSYREMLAWVAAQLRPALHDVGGRLVPDKCRWSSVLPGSMPRCPGLSRDMPLLQPFDDRLSIARAPQIRLDARTPIQGIKPRPLRWRQAARGGLQLGKNDARRAY